MERSNNGSNWLTETMANRPFIVGALFLGTYFVPFLILIGVALAYIFKRNPEEDWEVSHFQYLIRTFWLGILIAVFAGLLALAGIAIMGDVDSGGVVLALLLVVAGFVAVALCGVRIVISMMRSASHKPMPKPTTWLI